MTTDASEAVVATTPYPHPVLTRLHEPGRPPTRKALLQVEIELNANAASVDSVYGAHGHVFLTLPDDDYTTLNEGQQFDIPPQPPIDPALPAGATQAQITETVRQHTNAWSAYRRMRKTEVELRNQLLAAADDIYFRPLRHPTLGYAPNTVRQLLTHLRTTYGRFTEAERKAVTSRLNTPWEGGPFEVVIEQIEDAANAFNMGGTPMTDTQKRDKLYDLVNDSGLLVDACQRWRMKPSAEKTWDAAKAHFQQYATDRDEVITAGGAGYGQANLMTDAFCQLTNQMANLVTTDNQKMEMITDLKSQLAAAQAALTAYKEATTKAKTNTNNRNRQRKPNDKYCWSHGMCRHIGKDCEQRKEGHIEEATADNTMGGAPSS